MLRHEFRHAAWNTVNQIFLNNKKTALCTCWHVNDINGEKILHTNLSKGHARVDALIHALQLEASEHVPLPDEWQTLREKLQQDPNMKYYLFNTGSFTVISKNDPIVLSGSGEYFSPVCEKKAKVKLFFIKKIQLILIK